jgi:GR25 family glycosyltransferase involved in LPS biosynthesis
MILGMCLVIGLIIGFLVDGRRDQTPFEKPSVRWGPVEFDQDVYLISMESRPDRRDAAIETLKKLGINNVNIFKAINGRKYTREQWEELGFSGSLTAGMRGCAASHLGVWKEALRKKRGALVFEDDIYVDDKGVRQWNEMIRDFPKGAHIVYIGHCESQDYTKDCADDGSKFHHCRLAPLCTHAYYIPFETIQLFLSSGHPIDVPIDVWMRDEMMRQRLGGVYIGANNRRRTTRFYGEGAVIQNRHDLRDTGVTSFSLDYTREL